MKPFSLYSNAVRAKEIVTTLVRYGFDNILYELDLPAPLKRQLASGETQGQTTFERIRYACEELGPTFVKFAQTLSNRGDIVPFELIRELKKLRKHVRPVDWAEVKPILERELDHQIDEVFEEFDPTPVAAGSLGQIYRGLLRADYASLGPPPRSIIARQPDRERPDDAELSRWVAVKVQRPKIRDAIIADLDILAWLARMAHERIERVRPFNLPSVVEETRRTMMIELDFTSEARNANLFNHMNPDPENVFAPRVYDRFTTVRLLIAEWIDGPSPDEIELTPEKGRDLAEVGGTSILHQIVIAGFFHGDPHPGNMIVCKDGRLCLVDWGLAGQLTNPMRYLLADLFSAISSLDVQAVVDVGRRMSRGNRPLDTQKLEKEVLNVMRKFHGLLETGRGFGNIGLELLYVFGSNGINVAENYTVLTKSVVSIEQTGRALDPDFDIRRIAKPFIERLNWERWNPLNLAKDAVYRLRAASNAIAEIPVDVRRLVRRIEDEDVSIQLHHRGFEELNDTLNIISNRISLALILSAMLVGSSIIMGANIPPRVGDVSIIGIVGYVIAAGLGIVIVFDIFRHSRHKR